MLDRCTAVAIKAGIIAAEVQKPFTWRNCEMRSMTVLAIIMGRNIPSGKQMTRFTELRGTVVHYKKVPEGVVMRVMTGGTMDLIVSSKPKRSRQALYTRKLRVRQR